MSIFTPIFNLFKLEKTEDFDIAQFNDNMDIIDEEMAKPPLTVTEIEPDPETRNIPITTVPLADNLTSDEAQINTGTYIIRTSGGEASIEDGSAWLAEIRGFMLKTGYVEEVLNMAVNAAAREEGVDPITATLDRDTFISVVSASQTLTFNFTTAWSADPEIYGITVTGTPISGDQIVVTYVKGNRGTITTAAPTTFVSTGWNLYNHTAGYARVVNYSSEYGFMIDGTYTALSFAETLSGEQTSITPVDGYFTLPAGVSDGYVFVTGGNATDTEIWMTWSDWTDEANGGVFQAYTQNSIDLSGVMVNFPDGLMRIGNYWDEINLNTGRAYSRVQKMEYNAENLEAVIASGVPYDTDTGYIYAVRSTPVTYTISLSGEYTASDHGLEIFMGTSVPVTGSSLYGNDLKGKLRRDVLTISQQTLTDAQKGQVLQNIGASPAMGIVQNGDMATTAIAAGEYVIWKGKVCTADAAITSGTALKSTAGTGKNLTECEKGGFNSLNGKITTSYDNTTASPGSLGVLKSGNTRTLRFTNASVATILTYTLPQEYRPRDIIIFPIIYRDTNWANGCLGSVSINTNGTLKVYKLVNGALDAATTGIADGFCTWIVE